MVYQRRAFSEGENEMNEVETNDSDQIDMTYLLPKMYSFLQALKDLNLLDRKDIELELMGYIFSWRKK